MKDYSNKDFGDDMKNAYKRGSKKRAKKALNPFAPKRPMQPMQGPAQNPLQQPGTPSFKRSKKGAKKRKVSQVDQDGKSQPLKKKRKSR